MEIICDGKVSCNSKAMLLKVKITDIFTIVENTREEVENYKQGIVFQKTPCNLCCLY